MRKIQALIVCLLCLSAASVFAQRGDGAVAAPDNGFVPNAIYEIRYWTNMARMGDDQVYIDTMMFFGNDRAVFEYSNANCVSYHCRDSDSLVYVLLPKFNTGQKEFLMGDYIIKKLYDVNAPFRGFDRKINKIYVSDMHNKHSGYGDYVLVSRKFGIIYRWNQDGEIYMLNRIDIVRNGRLKDEINLLPLQEHLNTTDIFSGVN